jgi:acyl carrier protein
MFEEPLGNISEATARESIAGWDSLGTLTLMAEMDEKFDIQLSEKEAAGFASIGDVVDLLAQRGKLS